MGHQFYNNHKYNKFNGIHKIESKETGKSKKFIELAKCLYLNLAYFCDFEISKLLNKKRIQFQISY